MIMLTLTLKRTVLIFLKCLSEEVVGFIVAFGDHTEIMVSYYLAS